MTGDVRAHEHWTGAVHQASIMTSWLVYFSTNYIFAVPTTTATSTLLNNTYHWKSASSLLITSYSFLYNLHGRIHHIELDRFLPFTFSPCAKYALNGSNTFLVCETFRRYLHWLLSWAGAGVHTARSHICVRCSIFVMRNCWRAFYMLYNYKETAFN